MSEPSSPTGALRCAYCGTPAHPEHGVHYRCPQCGGRSIEMVWDCPLCQGPLVNVIPRYYVCVACRLIWHRGGRWSCERVNTKLKHLFRLWIWARDGGLCGICGFSVRFHDMTLDHIIPKSVGGQTRESNLQAAHELCNRQKADRTPEEYLAFVPTDNLAIRRRV